MSAAGLAMPDTDAETVLYTDGEQVETDIKVDDVPAAITHFVDAGGTLVRGPFDIAIGRCAVVRDLDGNVLVLLDTSKGLLRTDEQGNVIE